MWLNTTTGATEDESYLHNKEDCPHGEECRICNPPVPRPQHRNAGRIHAECAGVGSKSCQEAPGGKRRKVSGTRGQIISFVDMLNEQGFKCSCGGTFHIPALVTEAKAEVLAQEAATAPVAAPLVGPITDDWMSVPEDPEVLPLADEVEPPSAEVEEDADDWRNFCASYAGWKNAP